MRFIFAHYPDILPTALTSKDIINYINHIVLGRYTHKVAITSHRITGISEENVKFKYKDYADADKQKEMT